MPSRALRAVPSSRSWRQSPSEVASTPPSAPTSEALPTPAVMTLVISSDRSVQPQSAASNSTAPSSPMSEPAAAVRSPSTAAAASPSVAPWAPASMSADSRISSRVSVHRSSRVGSSPAAEPESRCTPGIRRTRSRCSTRLRSRSASAPRLSDTGPSPSRPSRSSSVVTSWTSGGAGVSGCRRPARSPLSAATMAATTGCVPRTIVPRRVQGSGCSRSSETSAATRPSSRSVRARTRCPRSLASPSVSVRAAIRSAVETYCLRLRSRATTTSVRPAAAPSGPLSQSRW